MNKLAPLFAATVIALSGAALAQDAAPSPQQDPQSGQEAQPKGFVLIQRNIYVPVDEQGNVASQKWIVIDKQGFITAEELEKAAREAGAGSSEAGPEGDAQGNSEDQPPKAQEPAATPSSAMPLLQQRRSIGEGPMVRS